MKITQKIGMLLLAVWLFVYGLSAIIKLSFEGMNFVMGGLAIAAAVLILLEK